LKQPGVKKISSLVVFMQGPMIRHANHPLSHLHFHLVSNESVWCESVLLLFHWLMKTFSILGYYKVCFSPLSIYLFKSSLELMLCVIDISTLNKTYLNLYLNQYFYGKLWYDKNQKFYKLNKFTVIYYPCIFNINMHKKWIGMQLQMYAKTFIFLFNSM
jgi:hypothetical protein